MTTTLLTADRYAYSDFSAKLTILVALEDLSLRDARRILAHVKKRYPNGNDLYCQQLIERIRINLPFVRMIRR